MDPGRIDSSEWTDDEWLRVMREFPPDADVQAAEKAVALWRIEAEGNA